MLYRLQSNTRYELGKTAGKSSRARFLQTSPLPALLANHSFKRYYENWETAYRHLWRRNLLTSSSKVLEHPSLDIGFHKHEIRPGCQRPRDILLSPRQYWDSFEAETWNPTLWLPPLAGLCQALCRLALRCPPPPTHLSCSICSSVDRSPRSCPPVDPFSCNPKRDLDICCLKPKYVTLSSESWGTEGEPTVWRPLRLNQLQCWLHFFVISGHGKLQTPPSVSRSKKFVFHKKFFVQIWRSIDPWGIPAGGDSRQVMGYIWSVRQALQCIPARSCANFKRPAINMRPSQFALSSTIRSVVQGRRTAMGRIFARKSGRWTSFHRFRYLSSIRLSWINIVFREKTWEKFTLVAKNDEPGRSG